jgi:hypothetical protein
LKSLRKEDEMNGNNVYTDAAAVTPSDSADLPRETCQGLMVTATGNLSVLLHGGGQLDLTGLAANVLLPLRIRRVRATGTTATVVALY